MQMLLLVPRSVHPCSNLHLSTVIMSTTAAAVTSTTTTRKMIQGVGVFRRFHVSGPQQDVKMLSKRISDLVLRLANNSNAPPVHSTMVFDDRQNVVVLVDEWSKKEQYSIYEETEQNGTKLTQEIHDLLTTHSTTTEFFPHALHIYHEKQDKLIKKKIIMIMI